MAFQGKQICKAAPQQLHFLVRYLKDPDFQSQFPQFPSIYRHTLISTKQIHWLTMRRTNWNRWWNCHSFPDEVSFPAWLFKYKSKVHHFPVWSIFKLQWNLVLFCSMLPCFIEDDNSRLHRWNFFSKNYLGKIQWMVLSNLMVSVLLCSTFICALLLPYKAGSAC